MNQAVEAACFENELPWESYLQNLVFHLIVIRGFAKNVHCYLTKIGFTLFAPNVAPGTWVRCAILPLKKWPLPNQSKHPPPPYSKTAKPISIW